MGNGQRHGHLLWGEQILGSANLDEVEPDQTRAWHWNTNFQVDYGSFEKGEPVEGDFIKCFKDGSKMQEHADWGY